MVDNAVTRLNKRSGIVHKIRIVHEDAIALMPDGSIKMVEDVKSTRPLMVLNPDECTPDKFNELLASGIYRRRYADFKIIPQIERGLFPDKPDSLTYSDKLGEDMRYALFGILPEDPVSQELIAKDSTTLDKDREHSLMRFYDQKITRFANDLEGTLEACKELHRTAVDNKRTPGGHALSDTWADISDEQRVKRRDTLKKGLLELPPTMLAFMERKDVEISDATPVYDCSKPDASYRLGYVEVVGNRITYANAGQGVVNAGDAKTHINYRQRHVILEEAVHYVDAMCCTPLSPRMWSHNKDWQDAVSRESLSAKLEVEHLMGQRDKSASKSSLFFSDDYKQDHVPTEFLANIAVLDAFPPKGFNREKLEKLLPETYPLYRQFMRSMEGHVLDRVSRERESLDSEPSQSRQA